MIKLCLLQCQALFSEQSPIEGARSLEDLERIINQPINRLQ